MPFVRGMLCPSTVGAILASGFSPDLWRMRHDDTYFELFSEFWRRGEDFAIIEHDIEVGPETLAGFERCPGLWCSHSYDIYQGDIASTYGGPWGLGCVRFRAELMAARPELPEMVGRESIDNHWPAKHWAQLDSTVTQWLKGPYAMQVCHHVPPVTHHHVYQREGAYRP